MNHNLYNANVTLLSVWSDFAFKVVEMMFASSIVIGQRTALMGRAIASPRSADLREITTMRSEKISASIESAHAMTWSMMKLNQQLAAAAYRQLWRGAIDVVSLASSRTPAQTVERQTRLAANAVTGSTLDTLRMSTSSAKLLGRGIDPIRSRVKANAKRLGRR